VQVSLLTDSEYERMAGQVVEVLGTIGMVIGHERVKQMVLAAGCKESPQGRVLFPPALIETNTATLQQTHGPHQDASAELHPRQPFTTGFGNLVPKVFDFAARRSVPGDTLSFRRLVRFAHTEPRVSSVTIPLSRQDVAPQMEQIDAVPVMAELTDKPLGSVDATYPEAVPFLAEMGAALGHEPGLFVGRCNCINPALRLEARTAETMLQRARYHSPAMMTTMTNIGGTGPVDIWGCIVLGTAEIVGGQILASIIDPEAKLIGYTATTQIDMRTGSLSESTPQTTQVDAGIFQLVQRHFGGGTAVGGRGYISAKRPGLQAVFERFLKAAGYAAFVDQGMLSFPGTGNLDNGSVISPEQFLLDLEIMQALDQLWSRPVPAEDDVPARLREGIMDAHGNFLGSPHTLENFLQEAWEPSYFARGTETKDEAAILAACHEQYTVTLKAYRPAGYPEGVLRELRLIKDRAARVLTA